MSYDSGTSQSEDHDDHLIKDGLISTSNHTRQVRPFLQRLLQRSRLSDAQKNSRLVTPCCPPGTLCCHQCAYNFRLQNVLHRLQLQVDDYENASLQNVLNSKHSNHDLSVSFEFLHDLFFDTSSTPNHQCPEVSLQSLLKVARLQLLDRVEQAIIPVGVLLLQAQDTQGIEDWRAEIHARDLTILAQGFPTSSILIHQNKSKRALKADQNQQLDSDQSAIAYAFASPTVADLPWGKITDLNQVKAVVSPVCDKLCIDPMYCASAHLHLHSLPSESTGVADLVTSPRFRQAQLTWIEKGVLFGYPLWFSIAAHVREFAGFHKHDS